MNLNRVLDKAGYQTRRDRQSVRRHESEKLRDKHAKEKEERKESPVQTVIPETERKENSEQCE